MDCSMQYQVGTDVSTHQAKVINLSAKGLLFIAQQPLPEGAAVKILITPVQPITPPLSAATIVSRCEQQSDQAFQIVAKIVQIDS